MTPAGERPRVGVIMGSDSDWPVMADAAAALAEFDIPAEVRVVSAHRTPEAMFSYARGARPSAVSGDHRRSGRGRALARYGRRRDAAAGDRGAGTAGQAGRP